MSSYYRMLQNFANLNLLNYSEDFTNAFWLKVSGGTGSVPTITPNVGTAPNGTATADRIVFNSGGTSSSTNYSVIQSSPVTTPVENNRSIYLKSFDGISTYTMFLGSTSPSASGINITVTPEWQRFDVPHTPSGTNTNFYLGTRVIVGGTLSNAPDLLIWGGQLTQGSDVKPYQKTT